MDLPLSAAARARLALAVAAALAACAAPWRSAFTFRNAEFWDPERAQTAGRAFLDAELPPGTPLPLARRRLRAVGMDCPAGPAPVVCDYFWVGHAEGGTLGEDHFEVTLTTDARGALVSSRLTRRFIGTGRPTPG